MPNAVFAESPASIGSATDSTPGTVVGSGGVDERRRRRGDRGRRERRFPVGARRDQHRHSGEKPRFPHCGTSYPDLPGSDGFRYSDGDMIAIRRRVRAVAFAWLLCQVASLSAFVPEAVLHFACSRSGRERKGGGVS